MLFLCSKGHKHKSLDGYKKCVDAAVMWRRTIAVQWKVIVSLETLTGSVHAVIVMRVKGEQEFWT